MTVEDPEWSDEDTAYALEVQAVDDRRCSGCGFDRVESMARGQDRHYVVEPVTCHACAERDRSANTFRQGKGETAGVYFPIRERG